MNPSRAITFLNTYIQQAVAGHLTERSPEADQPSWIRTPLRPHQRSLLAAARALESHAVMQQHIGEKQLVTTYGVLGDRVGAGKSLVALSLIRDPPTNVTQCTTVMGGGAQVMLSVPLPPVQEFTPATADSAAIDFMRSMKPFRNSVFYAKTSILLCPHNVAQQWSMYIKEQTTLRAVVIQKARDCSRTDQTNAQEVAFLNSIFTADIVVISCTMLKRFIEAITNRGDAMDTFVWSRLFIDEADSVSIPVRPGMFIARFTWLITGSWLNMLLPGGVHATHAMVLSPETRMLLGNGPVSGLYRSSPIVSNLVGRPTHMEPLFAKVVLRNADAWIDASIRSPTIIQNTIVCRASIQIALLRGLITPEAMEALHAGDATGALSALGLHPTSKETLVETVTRSLRRELVQAEKWLNYAREKDYSSPSAKLQSLERAEASVTELEAKICDLEERVAVTASDASDTVQCPICYDVLRTPTLTPCCRQTFCLSCLCECILAKPECPLCRVSIKSVCDLLVVGEAVEKVEEEEEESTLLQTKDLALLTILSESRDEQRFLVFSAHEASFNGIRQLLSGRGIRCEMLQGSAARIESLRSQFRDGKVRVLWMNTRHVGAGINLEMATDVILFHRMNVELERQVIGRAVRFERLTDLRVTHLIHENEAAMSNSNVIVHVE